MTSIRDQLITVYKENKADEVGQDPRYKALCREHDQVGSVFNRFRNCLAQLATRLEKRVESQITNQSQVVEALRLLNKTIQGRSAPGSEDLVRACEDLIKEKCLPRWDKEQTAHYETYRKALRSRNDYFLSFTSKNPDKPNESIVNGDHEYFIRSVLKERYKRENKVDNNLLAKAVNHLLKGPGELRGYYYPDREGNHTYVKDELVEEVGNCFAFVQIIQNMMFKVPIDNENYCFLEFKEASKSVLDKKACLIFILAERDNESFIKDTQVQDAYDKWHDEVTEKKQIVLGFTQEEDVRRTVSLRDRIRGKLHQQILDLKERLFEAAPADKPRQ